VTSVAAQAELKHWNRNGVKLAEGTVVPIVMYGGKVNLSQKDALGEINCKTVAGGTIENPTGGGAGTGRSNSASFYECKAPECEAEVLKATGLEGRGTATTQNNPGATKEPAFPGWSNRLEESEVAGVSSVREKIGEPFETFKSPSPPGMIRETVICEIAVNQMHVEEAIAEGELKPEIGVAKAGNLNGSSAAKPSTIKFSGASTGELGGPFSGSLKYLGYFEQELITVPGGPLALKLTPEGGVNGTGEWEFKGGEVKFLTIENLGPGPAELLTQQTKVIQGQANFTPEFLGPPEPPNCSPFSNPPVVSLPEGGKCNVGVKSAGNISSKAAYALTFREPTEAAKTIELRIVGP
jgi:hypothetical protein